MSKFVVVKKAPATLNKGEIVISEPDFIEQVSSVTRKSGTNRTLTGLNQLRDILSAIQDKYGCDLDIFKIPLSRYEGLEYKSDEQLSRIISQLLKTERPESFEKFLEYNIQNRPYGTKLIYFIGGFRETGPFFKNGIDAIDEKEINKYLGRKSKETEPATEEVAS